MPRMPKAAPNLPWAFSLGKALPLAKASEKNLPNAQYLAQRPLDPQGSLGKLFPNGAYIAFGEHNLKSFRLSLSLSLFPSIEDRRCNHKKGGFQVLQCYLGFCLWIWRSSDLGFATSTNITLPSKNFPCIPSMAL